VSSEVVLILARASDGAIGLKGKLPWRIPADLRRFKAMTMGQDGSGRPMIMGRKTFESFPRPLPGRRHIVLTRDPHWRKEGAEVAHSVEAALAMAGEGEVAVIGGSEIYALFLPGADRIELTEVHGSFTADTFMPAFGAEWRETARTEHAAEDGVPAHAFVTLRRTI
jgi:dihydrofolate reductase